MWNIVFCDCIAAGGSHSRPSEAVRPVRLWPHHFFQISKKKSLISFLILGNCPSVPASRKLTECPGIACQLASFPGTRFGI